MHKETVQFATVKENGIVTQVGKSVITQPKKGLKCNRVKWYEDRQKQQYK